jgi:beta-lactamase class A
MTPRVSLAACLSFCLMAAASGGWQAGPVRAVPEGIPALPEGVRAQLAKAPGQVWFQARNLRSGKTLEWRAGEKVRTASTIKLPIMAALFAEAAAGRVRWDQPVPLQAHNVVSGSGVLQEFTPGISLPLRDVMRLMIVVSDNTATNLIIELITADRVNEFLDSQGFRDTRSMRKVRGDGTQLKEASGWSKAGLLEENKRFGLGSSSARDMVRLLEMLHRGELVSADASREMLAVLKRQQYKDGIGRKTGALEVASKSGSLDRLRSDVGIVYTANGPVAMAITVDDLPATDYSAENPALPWIGELARILVAELSLP